MKHRKRIIGTILSAIMLLTMMPLQSFGETLPFTDIQESAWYYNDLRKAWETGLIDGLDATSFAPDEDMTYAQAVKLAACMNQKYLTGTVTLTNGTPEWYDSYVEYAKSSSIISKNYEWNAPATRAGYAEIFANAMPEEALKAKNSIADGYIPDVGMGHPQAAAVYKLYRAGILTGNDEIGSFAPDRNIKRSEVSAILTRMMEENTRKDLALGPVNKNTKKERKPVPVIIDTDIGNSTDDLFALEIAYRLMDLGYLNIEGIISNRMGDGYADILDIENTYYGYPDIPIGVERNGIANSNQYIDYRILDELTNSDGSRMFARTDEDLSDNLDGYKLYRKILGQAEDHSVKIIAIGFVSAIVQLMDSQPDEYSPLNGMDLIRQKVDSLYFMGTKLGESDELGYNLRYDISLAKRLVEEWPKEVPVYLSPSPVGDSIEYKPDVVLADLKYDENNPIRQTYEKKDCNTGQKMWDHLCVMNAAFPDYFTYSSTGTLSVTDDKTIVFNETPDGPFRYQLLGDDVWIEQQLILLRYFTLMH